jgi:hypothetical protein
MENTKYCLAESAGRLSYPINRSTDLHRRISYGDVYVKLLSLGSSSRTAEEPCVLYLLLWNLNLKEAVRNG